MRISNARKGCRVYLSQNELNVLHSILGFVKSVDTNESSIYGTYEKVKVFLDNLDANEKQLNALNRMCKVLEIFKGGNMSKGSGRRPQQIDDEEMFNNWKRIFNKTEDKPVPNGSTHVFTSLCGTDEYRACVYPDKYDDKNDQWIMRCDVEHRMDYSGEYTSELSELIASGVLKHKEQVFEPQEVAEDVIENIKAWAESFGCNYPTCKQ